MISPSPELELTLHAAGPLQARLAYPAVPGESTWYLLAHPHPLHGGTMDNKVVQVLARRLQQRGCPTLRFNFRGVGASAGAYDEGRGERDDLEAALHFLRRGQGAERVVAIGYSFGSWVAARLWASLPQPPGPLVLVAPPLAHWDFAELDGYAGPVLAVVGDRDEFCSPAALAALQQRCGPSMETRVLPGVDHFYHRSLSTLWETVALGLGIE